MPEILSVARPSRPPGVALAEFHASGSALLLAVPLVAVAIAVSTVTSTLVWLALAVVAVAAVVACVRWPGFGLVALVAFLPFNDIAGQILGPGTAPAVAVGAMKDVLLLALAGALMLRARSDGATFPGSLRSWLILTLAIGALAGVMTGDVLQALYGWRNDFQPLLLLGVVPLVVTLTDARRVLTTIVAAGEVAAGIALVTHQIGLSWLLGLKLDLPPGATLPTSYFSAGSITPRAFSPYVGPNELGLACVLVLTVILYRPGWSRAQRSALAVLPALALLVSASRSAWLGLAVLIVFEVVRRLRTRRMMPVRIAAVALSAGAIALAIALLASSGDPSIGGHQASLLASVQLLLAHPFGLGTGLVGPRSTRFGSNDVQTESFVLVIALEAGVLALVCYVAVMLSAVLTLLRARLMFTGNPSVLTVGIAALIASLPSQLVIPALQDGAVSWLLWVIVGVSLACAIRARRQAGLSETPPLASHARAVVQLNQLREAR